MRLSTITFSAVNNWHYRVVVIGGGAGGSAISHRCRKLLGKNQVAVIEPNDEHHYQPGYTLVGGGLYTIEKCIKPMKNILHPDNAWIQQAAKKIVPQQNYVELSDGSIVNYELLIVATGIDVRYDLIDGLTEDVLNGPHICSIYRADLAKKTERMLKEFDGTNAVFTLPNAPIKCSGAGQKICYLAHEIFKKRGISDRVHLTYNTYLPDVFDVPKYAKTLNEVIRQKSIELRVLRNLKSVNIDKKEATFELLNGTQPTGQTEIQKFDLLHVAPPCSAPQVLLNSPSLTNVNGFLDVDAQTLQHKKFPNVFGIGDCCGTPNKKTAAAVYSQMRALNVNVPRALEKKKTQPVYDGYSSCPLIVSFNRVILAEFTPKGPLETMPVDQSKPRLISFFIKRYFLPMFYWKFSVNGKWFGPATMRKWFHLGFSK